MVLKLCNVSMLCAIYTGTIKVNYCLLVNRTSRNGPCSNKLPKYAYNWMAPELLSGQQSVMEESDVYSLTAILWEVLSG